MGFFDVPTVQRSPWGILCLILNIVPIPGVGTIVAGVVSKENMTRDIIKGILQIVIPFLGWIWGIIDGIRIFMKSS